jgi:hypothetical protein
MPDLGSRVDKIPDPDLHQKTETKFKKRPGMFIPDPDPGSGFFPMPDPNLGSRGQTSTGSRICNARILDI